MEFFPAIDEEQFRFIKRIIDESDYYVVIVSGLYGSLAADGLSYTEKEYDYALSKGMPICALLRENLGALPENMKETGPAKFAKLEKFRDRISEGRLVAFWNDENELCLKLVQSLALTTKTYPGKGWIRGGDEEPLELLRKIQSLESENRTLTERLESFQEKRLTISTEMKAFLESKITAPYTYKRYVHGSTDTLNATKELTWAEISNAVLPKFSAPVTTGHLTIVIEALIKDITERSGVDVRSDIVDTIKVTLSAFNLIHCYPAKALNGGVIEFIQVTELGTRGLTLLKLNKAGVQPPSEV